jgi:hypothetical protein
MLIIGMGNNIKYLGRGLTPTLPITPLDPGPSKLRFYGRKEK